MDRRSRLGQMTRRADCSTSGPTRSWLCMRMTRLSVASPVSPSARVADSSSQATTTSTPTSGTPSRQSDQVHLHSQKCMSSKQFYHLVGSRTHKPTRIASYCASSTECSKHSHKTKKVFFFKFLSVFFSTWCDKRS